MVEIFNINTFRVVDGTIPFSNTSNDTTIFSDELSSPVTDITETLDDETFALHARFNTELFHERLVVKEISSAIEDTKTSRFSSTSDTTLVKSLTSDTTVSIDILVTEESLISILHPRHFSFTSTQIRSGNVDGSTDEALLS